MLDLKWWRIPRSYLCVCAMYAHIIMGTRWSAVAVDQHSAPFYGGAMTDENGVTESSEDETAVHDDDGKLPIGTSELEQEIKELEKLLRIEREERRRIQTDAQLTFSTRQETEKHTSNSASSNGQKLVWLGSKH
ncbi:unnamed protein product [Heligmosomoides polygyrus]|uniref:Cytohesin-1 n=1 Tax=Heligmosomoides polygyrus TaxID=6339 RepID=A0A183GWU2_HELPZ|nr:unnamed protein product [Heligmosomoides polygyrus]